MEASEVQSYRIVIEEDLRWRLAEISFFESQLNNISPNGTTIPNRKKRDIYRKSLVSTLYSHFEGFFRLSMATYAEAINDLEINIEDANEYLVVSSLHTEFDKYDVHNNWERPSDFSNYRKSVRFHNRLKFINSIRTLFRGGKVNLHIGGPTTRDSVVYTESNLKPEVIDTILRQLGLHIEMGLDTKSSSRIMGLVSQFVKDRNSIVHGDTVYKNGITEQIYNNHKRVFELITSDLPIVITRSLLHKKYLK